MKNIIAHYFTFSAFCTLYMGYFPLRFVLDESHPKPSNVIIEPVFLNYIFFILFPPTNLQYVWNHGRKSQKGEEASLILKS